MVQIRNSIDPRATHAVKCLKDLQVLLWPPEDPDKQWSSDTIADVAVILAQYGFGRPKGLNHGRR